MQYTTAAEAVKLIQSNQSVYIQGSTSIPEVLVAAMADRGEELRGVKVYSAFAVGAHDAPYCRPEFRKSFLVNSLFVATTSAAGSPTGTDSRSRPSWARSPDCSATARCRSAWR